MLTREVPFKGFEGLQVAWLVVEKQEVSEHTHTCMQLPKPAANSTKKAQGWRRLEEQCDALMVSTVSC